MSAASFFRHSTFPSAAVIPNSARTAITSPVTSPRLSGVNVAEHWKFTRRFHPTGAQLDFQKDLALGQHEWLPDLSVQREAASTPKLKKPLSENPGALERYKLASGGKEGKRSAVEELGFLKGKNGRPDMTWEDIADPDSVYAKTARRLFENTEGSISLTLAGMDMGCHFRGRAKVIQQFGSLEQFFQTAKKGELDYETGLSITGYELADLVEGPSQAYQGKLELLHPTKRDDAGKPEILDKRQFIALYNEAVAATSSPANLKLYGEIGLFTAEAEAAIAKLQEFVHGHSNSLTEINLYRS